MLCNKKLKNVLACICMLVIFTGCGGKDGLVGLESLESRGDISHEEVLPAETDSAWCLRRAGRWKSCPMRSF